jgi:ubiquinone/menaquinone biosynthesis C-methylase UbiE
MSTPSELERRIATLAQFFPTTRIAHRSIRSEDIIDYYRQSTPGYNLFHSHDGSIHLALNPDGRYDPKGYARQPELVAAIAQANSAKMLLELGCGRGYNMAILARLLPASDLIGIDLSKKHVKSALRSLRDIGNAYAQVGDFQDMSFADATFDLLYSIESFCHALNLHKALLETRRVAMAGAKFVVIDAWRTDAYDRASTTEQLAVELTEKAMAVASTTTFSAWREAARQAGWSVDSDGVDDLRAEVMPNMERFERMAQRYLNHPRTVRWSRRIWRGHLLDNAIAGYLMAQTVRQGLHTYQSVTLTAV